MNLDKLRRMLLESPELYSFLWLSKPNDNYANFVDQVINDMYNLYSNYAKKAVLKAIELKPDNFKFSLEFFDE